ncbi:MAG: alcohol dehydrogenase, partial [Maribacter sp.]
MDTKNDREIEKSSNVNTGGYRNFPMVPRVVFGKDSFNQLGEILLPKRKHSDAPFIFLVDDVFEGTEVASKIPVIFNDQIVFISAEEEPKTEQVDVLVQKIQSEYSELPSGIVGIG